MVGQHRPLFIYKYRIPVSFNSTSPRSVGGPNALVKSIPAQKHKEIGLLYRLRLPIVV
jgi:hypothetical protein